MRPLLRSIATALLCAAAVVAADAAFRSSLLDRVRPIILTPLDRAIVRPPVRLSWEGRDEMEVFLAPFGEVARSLGVHTSPYDIAREHFPREGGYEVEIRAPGWRGWIAAQRKFQMHRTRASTESSPDPGGPESPDDDSRYLQLAFEAARNARDKARTRMRSLRRDNAALRDEARRLEGRLDELYVAQDEDGRELAALEGDLLDATSALRSPRDENAELRFRLANVIPCSAWGYFSFPRPQTIPPSRRIVRVSDTGGNIFRTRDFCEAARQTDSTADSPCFCVGESFAR